MQYDDNGGINVCLIIKLPGKQMVLTVPLNTEQFTPVAEISVLDKDGKRIDLTQLSANRINGKTKMTLSRADKKR